MHKIYTTKKYLLNSGFTVLEIIVVIAIFSILAGITMANFGAFKNNTDFAVSVQEVALLIKEQQQNAMAGKLPNIDPGVKEYPSVNWKPAYGVYFDTATINNENRKMTIFYDNDNVLVYPQPGYELYEYVLGVNDINATSYVCTDFKNECIKEVTFEKIKLKKICKGGYSNGTCSSIINTLDNLSLVFKRPFPDTHMKTKYTLSATPSSPDTVDTFVDLVLKLMELMDPVILFKLIQLVQ
jgi:prepilin-type N-terminal cleavage/methylation domain-containing protein